MTDKEIDKLADLIADKLIAKQKEYDEQFQIDLHQTLSDGLGNARLVSEEELVLGEEQHKGIKYWYSYSKGK
jgi:hypothetical protein